jgi:multidrug efflux pump subunit AcrA (membrane-fusion protein)
MRHTVRLGVTCALALGAGLIAAGCGASTDAPPTPQQASTVNLAPQNVTTLATGRVSSGPVISGQLTPAREGSVRAEVGGSLVSLTVDRGDAVASGAQIARVSSRDRHSGRA